jgi:hypothetical protein
MDRRRARVDIRQLGVWTTEVHLADPAESRDLDGEVDELGLGAA